MPLNTLRLNHQPSTHPNDRIVFIKPLPRPLSEQSSYETADLLLRAIAAQCLPIMKSNYLSVTTLEEYEPNPEFIGRNFNNGEIIQLVLKSKNGNWLPLNFIQMVMMHELAHNTHMNHGKGFWATRNKYAQDMRELWARSYTGDGLWGTGRTLAELGSVMSGNIVRSEQLKDLPLCGGTFRSRGRKRKRKTDESTWKEKRDRRIEKKFGKNGQALGQDEDKRLGLEILGKGPVGVKPRVAQSKRGRELRAAAALARFSNNKKESEEGETMKKEESDSLEDEDTSEFEDADTDLEDVKDAHGKRVLNGKGHGMVRVCGAENEDEVSVKQEMDELAGLDGLSFANIPVIQEKAERREDYLTTSNHTNHTNHNKQPKPQKPRNTTTMQRKSLPSPNNSSSKKPPKKPTANSNYKTPTPTPIPIPAPHPTQTNSSHQPTRPPPTLQTQCPICTTTNTSPLLPTCATCSHVLNIRKDPNCWKCTSEICNGSQYVNAGDCGLCGVCGFRRGTSGGLMDE